MPDPPKISVVTPSFNQCEFLEATIRSVLDQQYPRLEYLVIDGGSTDGSVDLLSKYSAAIHYCVSEPDSGQAEAVNKGLLRATGDVLCWINSDDLLEPGALRKVGDLYMKRPFHFLYGDGYKFRHGTSGRRRVRPGEVPPETLVVRDPIQQPSTFWTRELLDVVGPLDETLHYTLDWEFFIRISRQFRMTYVPIPFSTYRLHPGHKTGTGGSKRAAEIMQIIDRYAPVEWRAAYDAIYLHYEKIRGATQPERAKRAARFLIRHPHLLARHGSKVITAIRVLSA
jgi:glycosyltransferase involved in cell wall biosynthesis